MAQIFKPSANVLARYGPPAALLLLGLLAFAWVRAEWSPWVTRKGVPIDQPVPFSHQHHVGGLGIDCRYCHSAVEESSTAGMPETHTCMTCHSQVWTEAPVLEPVRRSYELEEPIRWVRVYDLPDFVYFDHSIHVHKGVGCESCHGRVDQMPITRKAYAFHMSFCLDCHRQPEKFIRPRELVFAFGYQLSGERQRRVGKQLLENYDIHTEQLSDCSVCHR